MASRGQALTVSFTAFDASTGLRKTGDAANITPRWIKDGTIAALTTATVTEVDATNAPGEYKVSLNATECTCDYGTLTGKSSTSNIEIVPVHIVFEQLPIAAPGAASGVALVGSNVGQATSVSGAVGSVAGNVAGNVVGSVASVTGNVGGNVTGSVGSVVAAVTAGTVSDKTGYSLSAGGVQAIWDALTSALTTVGSVGKRIADNLDAAISSRTKPADTQAAVTLVATTTAVTNDVGITQAAADKVWNSAARSLTTFGTLVADVATAVWAAATRTLSAVSDSSGVTTLLSRITGAVPLAADYSTARATKLDNLDTTISSRGTSTYAGADTSGTTTLLTRLSSVRAGNLDNLDAAVSTRLAASGYTAPDNADIVTALSDLVALIGRTDPTSALTAVKAVTDHLATMINGTPQFTATALALAPTGGGLAPSAAEVAAEVDTVLSGTHGSGEWGAASSATLYGESGTFLVSIDTFDTDGASGLEGVAVWVSRDSGGVNRSQTKLSDASGRVTFALDAGTIYIWRSRVGRTFANPETGTVG